MYHCQAHANGLMDGSLRASGDLIHASHKGPTMSSNLNPEKALIFRMAHRDNLPWILDHGLHARNGEISTRTTGTSETWT